jgi:phage baseplate assembly protein W
VNDLAKRDVRLAEKKIPGEIMTKVSRSALYNRDLGFSNFTEITDETSLLQNVYSCLLTSRGERLFNQNFGTRIEEKIFTLGDATEETELLKECIQAVETYEPRVTIDPERSSCNFDEAGQYNLILAVILPTARTEMLKFTFKSRGRYV